MSGGSTRTATVTASLCALRTPLRPASAARAGPSSRAARSRNRAVPSPAGSGPSVSTPSGSLQRGQRLLQGAARRRERSHPHGGGQPQLAALGELTLGEPGRVPADQRLHSRDRRVARRAAEDGRAALGSPRASAAAPSQRRTDSRQR